MPDNILEIGLYCIPLDAVDIILNSDIHPNHMAGQSLLDWPAVVFVTPTSARVCTLRWILPVGSDAARSGASSALQFSTTWARAVQPLPSLWELNRWNQTIQHGKIYFDDDDNLVLRMDVEPKGINSKQVVPIWRAWDGCVELVCELLVSVRMAAAKSSFN
jgi:hypothetical protein